MPLVVAVFSHPSIREQECFLLSQHGDLVVTAAAVTAFTWSENEEDEDTKLEHAFV